MVMTTLAARIEAATPPDRDRALDGLRALAIAGVVLGHWLVMALTSPADGVLRVRSPLAYLPAFAPLSWVLQLLALFFLVGGYAAARSLGRARECGEADRAWIRRRLLRLARPVVAVTAVLGAALPLLALAGAPEQTLRTVVSLVVQPLWFVGVYGLVTALTPAALAWDARLRAAAALPALGAVAAVDALRYGPWREQVPGWLGLATVLPGWGFVYLLGVGWAHDRFSRRGAVALVVGGAVLGAVLLVSAGYPASVVGVPGAGRSNAHPPSLLILALASVQCGLAILARNRLAGLLRRPRLWAAVSLVNAAALTIFCWHQVALLALSGAALLVAPGGVPGLVDVPDRLGWVALRLGWLPVQLALLGAFVLLARRFEAPWRDVPGPARVAAAALAVGFAVFTYVLR